MRGPEVGGQGQTAGVQQVAVFQRLIVLVVVGGQAQGPGLDAHIDVLGHQHHFARGKLLAQGRYHAQDLVVRLALGQAGGQSVVQRLGLEQQLAARIAVAGAGQLETGRDVGARCAGQGVQGAAGLARIAGHFRHALFVAVELFEHDHGQVDVVFFKAEQTHRIVHQHIGVEHKQLGRTGMYAFAPSAGASGFDGDRWRCLGRGFQGSQLGQKGGWCLGQRDLGCDAARHGRHALGFAWWPMAARRGIKSLGGQAVGALGGGRRQGHVGWLVKNGL